MLEKIKKDRKPEVFCTEKFRKESARKAE